MLFLSTHHRGRGTGLLAWLQHQRQSPGAALGAFREPGPLSLKGLMMNPAWTLIPGLQPARCSANIACRVHSIPSLQHHRGLWPEHSAWGWAFVGKVREQRSLGLRYLTLFSLLACPQELSLNPQQRRLRAVICGRRGRGVRGCWVRGCWRVPGWSWKGSRGFPSSAPAAASP